MKICVIPARGGSKRIPMKNIQDFCGKPIIAWSIDTALKSNLFDKVVVTTDNAEIASVAKKYGAEVPFVRPADLSDDFSGTNAVVKHAIQWFISNGMNIDYACCLYATAPFVCSKYLEEGYRKLIRTQKSFAFSVTTFPFPIKRALRIKGDCVEPIWPENTMARSQDFEEAYHDAGQFYWGKANAFLDNKVLFSNKSIPVIIPRYLVQDIDSVEDWKRAELMFSALIARNEFQHF